MGELSGPDRHEIDAVDGARQASTVARRADHERTDVVVVGAGPCGLAAGIALGKVGLRAVMLERGCLVSGIYGYPTFMTFFSTAERLSIGGIPFSVPTEKPTRRDALAYYRTVAHHFELDVRQYEAVERVERFGVDDPVVPAGIEAVGGVSRGGVLPGELLPGDELASDQLAGDDFASGHLSGARGAPPNNRMAPAPPTSATESTQVDAPGRAPLPPRFRVHSRTRSGRARTTDAGAVVIATGYFGHPNRLGVPGEELPHVTHLFEEGHVAFGLPVVVVGGGNSAVDAALDLYRAGARVTMVHFGPELDRNVKPWVMPDITNRIKEGSIGALMAARVTSIEPETVVVATPRGEERIAAEQVYLMLGYQPNNGLLQQLGVSIDPDSGIPTHDATTMETSVPGVYMAGVLASGYDANKTFIENGRHHGDLIARHLSLAAGA